MTDSADSIRTLADLVEDFPIAMIVTLEGGRPLAQPFAMQQQHHEFDGDLWFLTTVDSSTATRLAAEPIVGITLSAQDSWVSLTGHAELAAEDSFIDAMWDASVEAWFPNGREDPSIRALIVHVDSAEYWDTPGGRIATVLSFVKSKASGQPMDIDSAKVDL